MKKYIKDNRGFTLVELLAVIVILVLIMGLAFYSLQGVIDNVRHSSARATAQQYIAGVRSNLLAYNLGIEPGYYYINYKMLEKNVDSPWGKYMYYTDEAYTYNTSTDIKDKLTSSRGFAKADDTITCGGNQPTGSFVRVSQNANGDYIFYVCLYDDAGKYMIGSEAAVSDSDTEVIDNTAGLTCDLVTRTCS